MNKKTVTSTLAMLLSLSCIGTRQASAQDTVDASITTEPSAAPADGAPPSEPAPVDDTSTTPPEEPSSESVATESAETTSYEASADTSAEGSTEESGEPSAPQLPQGVHFRWGAQLGYLFPTDAKRGFRAAKWLPIGLEGGLGKGSSPFFLVAKVDASPLCFGGSDCSGYQIRALAGVEVGIQRASDSVLHMVYFNASLGYRYATSELETKSGSTANGKLDGKSMLISEVSAAMMFPLSRSFSLGPRVALSSNLTGNSPEGVSSMQLGVRVLHAPL